jgi:hypothetical protein
VHVFFLVFFVQSHEQSSCGVEGLIVAVGHGRKMSIVDISILITGLQSSPVSNRATEQASKQADKTLSTTHNITTLFQAPQHKQKHHSSQSSRVIYHSYCHWQSRNPLIEFGINRTNFLASTEPNLSLSVKRNHAPT